MTKFSTLYAKNVQKYNMDIVLENFCLWFDLFEPMKETWVHGNDIDQSYSLDQLKSYHWCVMNIAML